MISVPRAYVPLCFRMRTTILVERSWIMIVILRSDNHLRQPDWTVKKTNEFHQGHIIPSSACSFTVLLVSTFTCGSNHSHFPSPWTPLVFSMVAPLRPDKLASLQRVACVLSRTALRILHPWETTLTTIDLPGLRSLAPTPHRIVTLRQIH